MEIDQSGANLKKVKLFEERGPTSRFVYAEILDTGDLVISAQDVGEAPRTMYGDDDYEWWVYVRAKDKDWVLLGLIEAVFGGRFHASDEFREWLKATGIPYEFDCYW
ncbi:MAG: hypothetical protein APR53_04210 [Methanoculleus sp. SDB]|nr:MAG: hypothetical protein APR53_04210 [Methanoculleus sp. SDB]